MKPASPQRFRTSGFMPSPTSRTNPGERSGRPAQSGDMEDTHPQSSRAHGTGRLRTAMEPRLEMPQFVEAEDRSVPTTSALEIRTPDFPNAFGYRQTLRFPTPTTQSSNSSNMPTHAPQHMPSRERPFAQQLALAPGTNNMPRPNNFPPPHSLNIPITSSTVGRTTQTTPTTPNFLLQPYDDYDSQQMYDPPLYSPMWPSTPTMTSQGALFPSLNVPAQQPMPFGETSHVSRPQTIESQTSKNASEELRLHQQRIRMAQRTQQQQTGPVPTYFGLHGSQQFGPQLRQDFPREQPSANPQPQQFPSGTNPRLSPSLQLYSPGNVPMAQTSSDRTNNLDNGKRRLPSRDDRAIKRMRTEDLGDLSDGRGLESANKQNVLAPSHRSDLPFAYNRIDHGRQHPLQQQRLSNNPDLASYIQQQAYQGSPFETVTDMPLGLQDLSPPQVQKLKDVLKTQRLGTIPPASHVRKDNVQPLGTLARPQTSFAPRRPDLSHGASPPTYPKQPPTPLSDRAPPQPQTPAELPVEKWASMLSPPTYPQAQRLQMVPEDVFTSMLQDVIDNAKGAEPVTKQQNKAAEPAASHELLLFGPLTKEQNSKALVEGVKEDMKRRGPSVGTNPDLDTAANPRFILDQRRKWTEKFMTESGLSNASGSYVPASEVMKSAVGYKPKS